MQSEIDNSIPTPILEFYELFKQKLSEVSFPDISLEVFEKLINDVHAKMNELQEANSRLLTAQEEVETAQNELLQKSIRGLAYAKIFAEDQEELSDQLSKINLLKTGKTTKKTEQTEGKRSRTKKSEPPQESATEDINDIVLE